VLLSSSIGMNNVAGLYGYTNPQVVWTPSKELRLGSLSHTAWLSAEGLKATASYSRSITHPGGATASLDLLGNSTSYRGELSYPLIRSRLENLWLKASLSARNARNNAIGTKLFEDRIRSATLEATYDFADAWLDDAMPATSAITARVTKGLDILNATESGAPLLSRANGRSDFTKVEFEAVRIQRLFAQTDAVLRLTGQYAFQPLLASEQIGFGGTGIGRGFEPSDITGDSGVGASLELRYTPDGWLGPFQWAQAYAFADYGKAWNRDVPAAGLRDAELSSAGAGLRVKLTDYVTISGEAAKPLGRDVAATRDRNWRGFFTVSVSF
jgi:hemolysin activation/secretion protein